MTRSGREAAALVVASHRGPVELRLDAKGRVREHRGAGGLLAVLGPALAHHGGVWVCAALTEEDRRAARDLSRGDVELPEGPVALRRLHLDPDAFDGYYRGVSIELLWFLHHHLFDLARQPRFDAALRSAWDDYRTINGAFADACAEEAGEGGIVLVQDHQLSLTPRQLRRRRPDLGVVHHTMVPWAAPREFSAVPLDLRRELVDGLLGADVVCFLVPRWAQAFLACCSDLGYTVDPDNAVVDHDGRPVAVRSTPVGVDAETLRSRASEVDVAAHRAELLVQTGGRRLLVRVERMEPAKNILRGLAAYAELLEKRKELHDQVVHFVLAYSSRSNVSTYQDYAREVHELADAINRRFSSGTWRPVILETANDFGRGLAAQSIAEVLVVNSLRDGMNLVAKEGPVVSKGRLVLVLSTETGAADELADAALLVEPLDVSELASAMATGLQMPAYERTRRLAALQVAATAAPPSVWLTASIGMLADARRSADKVARRTSNRLT